jgi:hypothetical protein
MTRRFATCPRALVTALLLATASCGPSGPSPEELAEQRRIAAEAAERRAQVERDAQSRVKAFATERLPDLQRAIDEAEREVQIVERGMNEYAASVRALGDDPDKDANHRAFSKELRSVRGVLDTLSNEREVAYKDYLATTLSREKVSGEEKRAKEQRMRAAIEQSSALVKSLRALRGAPTRAAASPPREQHTEPVRSARGGEPRVIGAARAPAAPAADAPSAARADELAVQPVAAAAPVAAATPPPAPAAVVAPASATRPGFVAAPPPSVGVMGSRLGATKERGGFGAAP